MPRKRLNITDCIRRDIVRGTWKRGERLPDRRWFMERYKAYPTTVQRAFDDLSNEGFVTAVRGHGTQVAEVLPYDSRYLLLLDSGRSDPASRPFSAAISQAAKEIEQRLGVVMDVRYVSHEHPESEVYQSIVANAKRHAYAGVFCEGVPHGEDGLSLANVNDVPIVFVGPKDEWSQGTMAFSLWDYAKRDPADAVRTLFLEYCRDHGGRRIAVFQSSGSRIGRQPDPEHKYREVARRYGVELVPFGYHNVEMSGFDVDQFERLVGLFLASSAGANAETIILADDNLTMPFVRACRRKFGVKAASTRYNVLSHCNFPLLPDVRGFPVSFHGLDLCETLASVVEYTTDCRNRLKKPRLPKFVIK